MKSILPAVLICFVSLSICTAHEDEQPIEPAPLNYIPNAVEAPIGSVMPFAGELTNKTRKRLKNSGWIVCDGKGLFKEDYRELYKVIKDHYGPTKKTIKHNKLHPESLQFNVPDYRGMFLRGLDDTVIGWDPDRDTRVHPITREEAKREIGSFQSHTAKIPKNIKIAHKTGHNHDPDPGRKGLAGIIEGGGHIHASKKGYNNMLLRNKKGTIGNDKFTYRGRGTNRELISSVILTDSSEKPGMREPNLTDSAHELKKGDKRNKHEHKIPEDGQGTVHTLLSRGGKETRPQNMYVHYIIKAKHITSKEQVFLKKLYELVCKDKDLAEKIFGKSSSELCELKIEEK